MATEQGIVTKTEGINAWVKTNRSSSCKSCSSRDSCTSVGDGNEMEIEAVNEAGAKEGERVVVSLETASLVKVFFVIYIFPILSMLAGAIIGQQVAHHLSIDESLIAVIFSFSFFFISFFIIKARGNKMAQDKAYKPRIVQILPPLR